MHDSEIDALAKGMVPFVREVVTEATAPLIARIAELEARPTEKGDVGEPGHIGEQGRPGDKGEKGDTGRDGRDASDLVLLFSRIDERVAAGIADVFKAASITSPDSGRTLVAEFGDKAHEIKTGIPLDRGVWKDSGIYVAGDSVSHGNSLFIAKTQTTSKPPSDDWRLAVRAGRDGKDYRPDDKRAPEPVRFK